MRRIAAKALGAIRRHHVGQLVILWLVAAAVGLWLARQYRVADGLANADFAAAADGMRALSESPTLDDASRRVAERSNASILELGAKQRDREAMILREGGVVLVALFAVTWIWFGGRRAPRQA